MTNEEAIIILNDYDINFERHTPEEVAEAHEMAIKALQTQQGENELSEEKIAEAFDKAIKSIKTIPSKNEEIIKVSKGALKARTGRFVIYDVEWLKEHFNTTESKIYGQLKTGHWLSHSEYCKMNNLIPSGLGRYFWCSECNCGIDYKYFRLTDYNYCPKCGAKMQEVQK